MSWSFGEIRSLAAKAARGFGMPWGLAEEAGFTVEWLEMRGLPGVEALARYLENAESLKAANCPVATGAAISDFGNFEQFLPTKLHQPALLIPFLAAIASDRSIVFKTGETSVTINAIGATGEFDALVAAEGLQECSAALSDQPVGGVKCTSRVPETRAAFINTLEHFAHKTYAPATEESRAKGAGAGTTDND